MKEVVEQLQSKLPDSGGYGLDIILDEDDLSGTGDSESVFDEIDDYDLDGSSGYFIEEDGILEFGGEPYGREWLVHQCVEYCGRRRGGAMEPEDLASNLILLLTSNSKSTLA